MSCIHTRECIRDIYAHLTELSDERGELLLSLSLQQTLDMCKGAQIWALCAGVAWELYTYVRGGEGHGEAPQIRGVRRIDSSKFLDRFGRRRAADLG